MSWIKHDSETARKVQVYALMEALGLPRPHILGALDLVWTWFSEQTVLGQSRTRPETLDAVSETPGFGAALVRVGWLIVLPDDAGIAMPNFDRHTGSAHEARRKADWRSRARPKTVPGQSVIVPMQSQSQSQSQSQKEEEEKSAPDGATNRPTRRDQPRKPEEVPIPEPLRAPEFVEVFSKFILHRKAKDPRDHWTAIAAERKLSQLAKLGAKEATRWVTFALDEGNKNIREPYEPGGRQGFERNGSHIPEKSKEQHLREAGLL